MRQQIVFYDKTTGQLLRRIRHSKTIRIRVKPHPHEAVLRAPVHVTLHSHRVVDGRLTKHTREPEPQRQQIRIQPKGTPQ